MTDTCEQALRRVVHNTMGDWQGLPPCNRETAERTFGPSPDGPDGAAAPGGRAMFFRNYSDPHDLAPHGVTVWFEADAAVALQINSPALGASPEAVFGQPETKLRSDLAPTLQQWVYPERGLALHVHPRKDLAKRLYGFAPMTLAEYEESWLSRVAMRRIPLRR